MTGPERRIEAFRIQTISLQILKNHSAWVITNHVGNYFKHFPQNTGRQEKIYTTIRQRRLIEGPPESVIRTPAEKDWSGAMICTAESDDRVVNTESINPNKNTGLLAEAQGHASNGTVCRFHPHTKHQQTTLSASRTPQSQGGAERWQKPSTHSVGA